MKDRWALLALGAWLMGSVLMIVVATRNFHLVDELLQSSLNAHFVALLQSSGKAATRELLRYLSSELNREYFQLWNVTQLALGGGTLLLIGRRSGHASARRLLLAASLLVAGMLLVLTPRITLVGRSLDFVPHEPAPPELRQFWILHVTYTCIELVKLVLLGLSAVWIAGRKQVVPGADTSPLAPSREPT